MAGRTIRVKVKPNAKDSVLVEPLLGDEWTARLKSPPVEGKANDELLGLVAKHFGVPRRDVSLKTGATSRLKVVVIAD